MERNNLIAILLINLIIIGGTLYLIKTRYDDYMNTRLSMARPADKTIPLPAADKDKEPEPKTVKTQAQPETANETDLRNIKFQYVSSTVKMVSIIGDFNDWTPHPLKKVSNKAWETTLRIKPGVYKYNYVTDGKVILDPYNSRPPIKTSRGFSSSVLELKPLQGKQKQ
jgi:hypothetical protein